MDRSIPQLKAELRREIRERLKAMSDAERQAGSAQIRTTLVATELWRGARSVLIYASMPGEVDIRPLGARALAEGKRVALPRYDAQRGDYAACEVRDWPGDLTAGAFGIQEPNQRCPVVELKLLDLALVPGVAFDQHGGRLGRGKGYYDRMLSSMRGVTCGVAFDEQVVDAVPVTPNDVLLNCLLTPTLWLQLTRRSGLE